MNGRHVTKHGMTYACNHCEFITTIWLEKGLEEGGATHKPVPFVVKCPHCASGYMNHIQFSSDVIFQDYRTIPEKENYFENADYSKCGRPVFGKEIGKRANGCPSCFEGSEEEKKMTNHDWLKSLSVEDFSFQMLEMRLNACHYCPNGFECSKFSCQQGHEAWLNSEYDEWRERGYRMHSRRSL